MMYLWSLFSFDALSSLLLTFYFDLGSQGFEKAELLLALFVGQATSTDFACANGSL